jgi:hypothetical protein
MSGTTPDADLAVVLELERELQTRACRNNRARGLELLAPDFTQIGASGRFWDLPSTLDLLNSQAEAGEEIEVSELTDRVVADGLILLHWDSAYQGRRAVAAPFGAMTRKAGAWCTTKAPFSTVENVRTSTCPSAANGELRRS